MHTPTSVSSNPTQRWTFGLRSGALLLGLALSGSPSLWAQNAPSADTGQQGQHQQMHQQAHQQMHQGMHQRMHEHRAERHAKHIGELKAKLQLSASQEPAWASFAQAMQPPAAPPARPDRAALEKLSTPERIDLLQTLHTQRSAEMQKRGDAAKAFYATLSPEQKKVFDSQTARHFAPGRHAAHRGG